MWPIQNAVGTTRNRPYVSLMIGATFYRKILQVPGRKPENTKSKSSKWLNRMFSRWLNIEQNEVF